MTRRDFSKMAGRANVAARGFEDVRGGMPLDGPAPRLRPSKASMRQKVADLFTPEVQITRVFRCHPCQFQFTARQALTPVEPMLCQRCGRPV